MCHKGPIIPERIYLDHAATTPLRPEARAAMEEGFALWANPSSPHGEGRKAKQALEDARAQVKAALGWPGEMIFTSGASEAAALALGHAKAGARLVSAVEHDAVLRAAPQAERLPVRPDGALDFDVLTEAVNREVPLVAVQHLNSETGNRQDLAAIGGIVHQAGGLLLADCAQSAAKLAIPAAADMAIISAHKFGGPIGIGALLVRDFALLDPAGGQERGYRRGTENLPGAVGMAAALVAADGAYLDEGMLAADEALAATVRDAGGTWLADRLSHPEPFIRAIAMQDMSAQAQLMRLDMAGFAVSQGSACSSGTMKSSPVLAAMGVEQELAERTIRISYGWNTTGEDVERFAEAWRGLAS